MNDNLHEFQVVPISTTEMLAYCYGFFDGEGTIGIKKPSPNKSYYVSVRATQKEIGPLIILKSMFGGSVRRSRRRGIWILHEWQITKRKEIVYFLETGMRYLLCKRSEAQAALNLIRAVESRNANRWSPLTGSDLEKQKVFYDECRKAKQLRSILVDEDGQSELPVAFRFSGV